MRGTICKTFCGCGGVFLSASALATSSDLQFRPFVRLRLDDCCSGQLVEQWEVKGTHM